MAKKDDKHDKKDDKGKNGSEEEVFEFDVETEDDELYMELDDERREEIDEMIGLKVMGVEIWEESLGDDEKAPPKADERIFFDCDLFWRTIKHWSFTSRLPIPTRTAIR